MELLRTEHWTLTYEEALHLMRATRTKAPYASVAEVEESMVQLIVAGQRMAGRKLKLLLDLREGPLRNDDGFEAVMARHRPRMFEAFDRVAIVVKTAVGKLQVSRIGRQEKQERPIFSEEAAALAYLSSRK